MVSRPTGARRVDDSATGWVALPRGLIEHPLLVPKGRWSTYEAWCWVIANAAYKETVIDLDGRPHTVPRRALCHSLRFLAERWGWSVKSVRTFLVNLEHHGLVRVEQVGPGPARGGRRTQITLCDYDRFQPPGHAAGTGRARRGHKEEQGNKSVEPEGSTLRAGRNAAAARPPELGARRRNRDGTQDEWCGAVDGWLRVRG